MTERHDVTGQELRPYRAHGEPLPKTPRRQRSEEPAEAAWVRQTNRELFDAWTTAIAALEGLRLQPKTPANKQAYETGREQLREAGDVLIMRITQSYADAIL